MNNATKHPRTSELSNNRLTDANWQWLEMIVEYGWNYDYKQSLCIQRKPQVPLLQLKIFYQIRQVFAFACYDGYKQNIKESIVCCTATFLTSELCWDRFLSALTFYATKWSLFRKNSGLFSDIFKSPCFCLKVLLPYKCILFAIYLASIPTSASYAYTNKKRLWTSKIWFHNTSPYIFCRQVNIL